MNAHLQNQTLTRMNAFLQNQTLTRMNTYLQNETLVWTHSHPHLRNQTLVVFPWRWNVVYISKPNLYWIHSKTIFVLYAADKTRNEGKPAGVECWRDSNPVYWTNTQSILVSPLQDKTAFVRVQPTSKSGTWSLSVCLSLLFSLSLSTFPSLFCCLLAYLS